ncbi:hypothetical protein MRQ36_25510 [Micromonospora sp. R77]|uniref:hypothetical protein n=1 Tax=Micromonospora sp. R77 TaxID=2925836 RepID=UPI001F61D628|nr:hypothetical protein [Micromonospora sp. R77]MCI4065732.1 hypothetical protein [Micromonospora sp. R77]
MRGVNATAPDLLDLCFALQGEAGILPYYFYMSAERRSVDSGKESLRSQLTRR